LGLVSAFILSFNSYTLLSAFIAHHTKLAGAKPDIVSFLFIFLSILLIFRILASVVHLFSHTENVFSVSGVIALVFGFLRGILVIGLIYTFSVNSPFQYLATSAKEKSFLGQYVSHVAPLVYKVGISCYPWGKVNTPLVKLLEQEA
jgi:hypothetical protein